MTYLGHHLKMWADPWGQITAEVKGGSIVLSYKRIYVTSQYLPWQCTEDKEVIRALIRRFKVIKLSMNGNWEMIDWD